MSRSSGIYLIRNKQNGGCYIGSAMWIERRWSKHRYDLVNGIHHSRHLQNAWNKYGADAFEFVIAEVVGDPKLLIEREQFWLDKGLGHYNIHPNARSPLGVKRPNFKLSPEALERIRAANRKRNKMPEMRAVSSARAIARNQTLEMRAAVSAASPARTGWRQSDEAKAKISAAKKGKMPYQVIRGPKGTFVKLSVEGRPEGGPPKQ